MCLVDAVTSDGEEDRSACVWTHIVAVVDSSSNYEQESLQKGPSSASVTLFINSEKAASGSVQVPPLKESDLAAPGVLYVCPCVPAGSRVTELRVVRHSFILLCSSLPCFVLSCPVLLYEHLHDIFLSYYRYTKAASPCPVLFFPSILSDTATTDLSYFTCALCEHSLPCPALHYPPLLHSTLSVLRDAFSHTSEPYTLLTLLASLDTAVHHTNSFYTLYYLSSLHHSGRMRDHLLKSIIIEKTILH